jgi:BlaI family transcriptional regulator, penicillinase repressor
LNPSRSSSRQLTPLETQIMQVLWDAGPGTVQQVQAKLPGSPALAYTTVQTMLNILHRKGRVKRALEGKAYRYEAVLSREKAITQSVGELADRLFGGSVEMLLMNLVKHRQIDRKKLKELNAIIEERLRREQEKKDGNG